MTDIIEVAYFVDMAARDKKKELDDPQNYHYGSFLRPNLFSPNYNFYVPNLVCWEHKRPRVRWDGTYNLFVAESSNDIAGFRCVVDNLLDPVSLKRCPECSGAFYDLFRHPYQSKGYHRCWNCLEAGRTSNVNSWFSRYTKLAPPEYLIPPPVTTEDTVEADNAFWNFIDSL